MPEPGQERRKLRHDRIERRGAAVIADENLERVGGECLPAELGEHQPQQVAPVEDGDDN
jgi:hypothetical protein